MDLFIKLQIQSEYETTKRKLKKFSKTILSGGKIDHVTVKFNFF